MSFAKERERRANAGSRMRALLDQEVEMEELFEESLSDDEEFITKPEDEVQDTVDSDFDTESSDEEREQEELGRQADKQMEKEERQARRVVPPAIQQQPRPKKPTRPTTERRKRREKDAVRQSSRANTVRSRLHVEEQMREYKSKRERLTKRDRPVVKQLTQEELLAEAAITEQENKASLEQWQQREAERKAKAKKQDKKRMVGPFVRYTSYTQDPDKRPKRRKIVMISMKDDQNVQEEITDAAAIAWQEKRDMEQSETMGRNLISFMNNDQEPKPVTVAGLSDRDLDRTDLIPELASWVDRPSRPVKPILCPITGLAARYLDPETKVPYANVEAYKVIRKCLSHKEGWSAEHRIYVGAPAAANGVPEGWERAMVGKRHDQVDWQRSNGSIDYPDWFKDMHAVYTRQL
ncbi:YL1 nuclear protein-domain-containing protein [Fennellomyces sp. T-0311]|nr:YL1 nuclear protein-domain-containing protein [Fennellomyces sp. T-0311]